MKVMCTEFMGWNIDAAIADFNPEISSVLTTCDGMCFTGQQFWGKHIFDTIDCCSWYLVRNMMPMSILYG